MSLPFTFPFYGETFSTVWITTEGYLTLGGHAPLVRQSTRCLAGGQPDQPDHAVYAFWEDLTIDEAASVWTATLGAEPDRVMVIGWQNVLIDGTDHRISFEAHLHESGRVSFQYREIPSETLPIAGVVGLEAAGAFAPRFEYLCGTESNFRKHRVVEGGRSRSGDPATWSAPSSTRRPVSRWRVRRSGHSGPTGRPSRR